MRTLNSGKNFLVTVSLMVTMTLLGFVTRKLFVNEIGVEYLGLNGLLTNILAAVTLLESGFGTSVVFHLYKPLAENDQPRILALLQFYRKVYRLIAAAVFLQLPHGRPTTPQTTRSASQSISATTEPSTRNNVTVPLHTVRRKWTASLNPFFGAFLSEPNG